MPDHVLDGMFTCEKCEETLSRYLDGEFQVAMGANFGWGMLEWCRKCTPVKTPEEILQDFHDFMFPKQEMPDETRP